MLKRTRAGLTAVKARSMLPGAARILRARKLLDAGEFNAQGVANLLSVSRATIFRELRKARDLKALEGGRR
jgi:transcriptional regulator of acetoin/glycerol metabolism